MLNANMKTRPHVYWSTTLPSRTETRRMGRTNSHITFSNARSKITETKVKLTHRIVINCEASNSSSKKLLSIGLGQEKDVLSIIMTPKVITIDADAKVEEALRLMLSQMSEA